MSNKQKKPLVPKLRFAEFQGSSSWQIRTLGQACHMQAGKFIPAAEIHDKYMQVFFLAMAGMVYADTQPHLPTTEGIRLSDVRGHFAEISSRESVSSTPLNTPLL